MLFQLLDADYLQNGKPIIRLFGRDTEGKAVCCFVEGFSPYFYARGDEKSLRELLEGKPEISSIESRKKFPAIGYRKEPVKVFKITVKKPEDVPKLREELIAKGKFEIFEADILFRYRFLIDHDLYGMDWIETDAKRTVTQTVKCTSYQAKEFKKIQKEENSDLKYMAFDIECLPKDFTKPLDSKQDPIIMISMAFSHEYKAKKTIVLVGKPVKTEKKNIFCFSTEEEMLKRFMEIIDDYDPDIMTGYNAQNFDLPYILERMRQNKIVPTFGRCSSKSAFSRKIGAGEQCFVPGRVVFDPYVVLKNDPGIKFRQYDLNTVAMEMLGEKKLDIKYRDMASHWNGTQEMINKFILYAEKDSELALKLVTEKKLIDKFFALSKISGLLLQDTFGGQSIRVETKLLHEFKKRNMLMPAKPAKEELNRRITERDSLGLKGATVLEPKKGLHTNGCTLVLDFKSLYPSIIRTYNISPDTIILEKESPVEKFSTSPTGARFVDSSIHPGTLPTVLKDLLDMRSKVKKEMKNASGDKKIMLDSTQFAIKIMANSFYGYTGFAMARLYVLEIASSITGYGRDNLQITREMIEKNFPYKVIYADTDSVFLETSITDLDEAKKVGEEVSKYVSENLPGYLELDFEKILRTFLILTKKRYAGWSFEKSKDGWKDKLVMKGIETVRRDWCPLVSDTMNTILIMILKQGDVKGATDYVKDIVQKLKRNEIPLEKLTMIKGITKNPKDYKGMLPHIELAKKLTSRRPEDPPQIGDRLGFVIIAGNNMLSKRAEDPDHVRENKIPIDSDYYINCQLLPAIERVLRAVDVTTTELLGGGRQTNIFDIVNNKKRVEKQEIVINYEKPIPKPVLGGWEEFICEKCRKSHKRIPLSGLCTCGGRIMISFQGSVAEKCKQ
jgi:DNA polymerase I